MKHLIIRFVNHITRQFGKLDFEDGYYELDLPLVALVSWYDDTDMVLSVWRKHGEFTSGDWKLIQEYPV